MGTLFGVTWGYGVEVEAMGWGWILWGGGGTYGVEVGPIGMSFGVSQGCGVCRVGVEAMGWRWNLWGGGGSCGVEVEAVGWGWDP